MAIKISLHAKQRIMERGLTEQQVRNFFATNEGLLSVETSDRDSTVSVMEAMINGRKYRLICNLIDDVLVTVYPLK